MRILYDLRGAQRWRERGIPRYIQNLIFALHEQHPDTKIVFLYDRAHESPIWHKELQSIGKIIYDSQDLSSEYFDTFVFGCVALSQEEEKKPLAEYLIPSGLSRKNFGLLSAIVYDFIPWRFPALYLSSPEKKARYLEGLDFLSNMDVLFTISRDVARDTAKLFPLIEAKGRIINLNGGPGALRGCPPSLDGADTAEILKKYSVQEKQYWLYIGGDESRKNLGELVRSSSLASSSAAYPLLIAGRIHEHRQTELLKELNRGRRRVQFTGYISDENLWLLLKNAFGSVFVSKYEGLGLPVLESLTVQTPVLCSNNSSLTDLVPEQCRLQGLSAEAIAEGMASAESASLQFTQASLEHWSHIQSQYRWEYSAQEFYRGLNLGPAHSDLPKHRPNNLSTQLFWVSILPPEQSGIAYFNQVIFDNDRENLPLFVVTNKSQYPNPEALSFKSSAPADWEYATIVSQPSAFIFTLGNSDHHHSTLNLMMRIAQRRTPKIRHWLYLHEAMMNDYFSWYFHEFQAYLSFLCLHYPEISEEIKRCRSREDLAALRIRGIRPIVTLGLIDGIFVNSQTAAELVREDLGPRKIPIETLFLPIPELSAPPHSASPNPTEILVGSFGIADDTKAPKNVLGACRRLRRNGKKVRLIFGGFDLNAIKIHLSSADLAWVELHENPNDQELFSLMATVHVAVQLRNKTSGEASGAVCQMLSLGTPMVVTRNGWFEELGEAVVHVSLDAQEKEIEDAILQAASGATELKHKMTDLCRRWSVGKFWKLVDQKLDILEADQQQL